MNTRNRILFNLKLRSSFSNASHPSSPTLVSTEIIVATKFHFILHAKLALIYIAHVPLNYSFDAWPDKLFLLKRLQTAANTWRVAC